VKFLHLTAWFSSIAILMMPAPAHADIAVIVNTANPAIQMNVQQVADLYLGRTRNFSSGEFALVFDQLRDSPLRARFFQTLSGMSQQQINAYWSRMMFSGQVIPPQQLPDDRTVLDIVRRNSGAIGYISAQAADTTVRTVLLLKE
jgi:hypothetical protein